MSLWQELNTEVREAVKAAIQDATRKGQGFAIAEALLDSGALSRIHEGRLAAIIELQRELIPTKATP